MKITDAKKLKIGDFLLDDCRLVYKVIDKLPNSIIVQSIGQSVPEDVACEILTYVCLEREDWKLVI